MPLNFGYQKIDDNACEVRLIGSVDEDCWTSLQQIANLQEQKITFDMRELDNINSLGVRNWLNFLNLVEKDHELSFENCPSIFIRQLNMIPRLRGHGDIISFYGEFYCEQCDAEKYNLFLTNTEFDHLIDSFENNTCNDCGGNTEVEEDVLNYLEFIKDQSKR